MKDSDYFEIDALSNSFLKRFDRSPAHAYTEMEETSYMKLGKFGHAFLLSPYEFKKLILAPPECEKRSLKPYSEFKKQHSGKENNIILHHEYESLRIIKEKLLDYNIEELNIKFGDIYNHKNCKKEIAAIYFDSEFELLIKGKLDLFFYNDEIPIIFDPKFTTNSSDLKYQIIDRRLKYYRQDAFYSFITEKLTGEKSLFYFIGIEQKKPYGIDFHKLSDDLRETGKIESFLSIQKYKNWVEAGSIIKSSWGGVNIVQKPAWMKF